MFSRNCGGSDAVLDVPTGYLGDGNCVLCEYVCLKVFYEMIGVVGADFRTHGHSRDPVVKFIHERESRRREWFVSWMCG